MPPSASESPASSSSGGSRYYVLRPLATGGMATVELALQVSPGGFERLTALKRVKPHLASSEDIAAMFGEEARIAARLNHPNLIHAYEVGRDGAGLFLAMEYLSGQSYGSLLERVGQASLELRVALETLIATLDGLECVHELSDISGRHMALVHRDISPSNIFVTYSGQVKVLDFGIAKARLSSIQTQIGVLKGKVSYMAPEQALGTKVDARADLYAVGVMLWEAIAGRRRWGALPEAQVVKQQMAGEAPESPGARARGLPALAERICLKALAFEPRDRFQSAAEFRTALEALSSELGPRLSARGLSEYVLGYFETERAHAEQQVERALASLERGGPHARSSQMPVPRETRAVLQPMGHSFAAPVAASARTSERPRRPAERLTPAAPPTIDTDHTLTLPGPVRSKRGLWFGAVGVVAALSALTWLRVRGTDAASQCVASAKPSDTPSLATAASVPSAVAALPPSVALTATSVALASPLTPSPSPSAASTVHKATPRSPTKAVSARPVQAAPAKRAGLSLDRGSPW